MTPTEMLKILLQAMGWLFLVFYAYQFVYVLVPFFVKKSWTDNTKSNRFAVLIAARNEEAVIAQLIESIRAQDYPAELVDVFVAADNCTDRTAAVAAAAGAEV